MVKRWLRSVLGGSASAAAEGQPVDGPVAAAPRDLAAVLDDLRQHVCAAARDFLPADAVDTHAHLYDAGYVDSISGADLLVHIERCYGLFIPETDLVGRLSSLDALARHIVSEAP